MKSNTIYRVLGIMGGLYGVTLLALLTLLFIDFRVGKILRIAAQINE